MIILIFDERTDPNTMQIRLHDLQALPNSISLKASKSNNLAEAGFAINVVGNDNLTAIFTASCIFANNEKIICNSRMQRCR